ncbi:MAG: type II toxin-antitoxin system VapC family toxin [Alphaproteobacteria bacterium]|nr:type II toxin-antitoxin system VapC family toxin [Alphaproteobacteria bacterium]
MAALVIDASFALALLLPDEVKPSASMLALLEKDGAVVPAIWPIEVGNTLVMAERRKRIAASALDRIADRLDALPIGVDERPVSEAWRACIALAVRHRLTVYDGAYLELAKRLRLPLATLDGDLRKAAKAEGVTV